MRGSTRRRSRPENEEEDVDPAEGRVEGHVRPGRDERADDGADERDDGEHEDEDPEAALDGTAAFIGLPHAKFAFGVRGLRYEGSIPPKPLPFRRTARKTRTLCASVNPGCQARLLGMPSVLHAASARFPKRGSPGSRAPGTGSSQTGSSGTIDSFPTSASIGSETRGRENLSWARSNH